MRKWKIQTSHHMVLENTEYIKEDRFCYFITRRVPRQDSYCKRNVKVRDFCRASANGAYNAQIVSDGKTDCSGV
ncbi:hypothetical protein J6590_000019 [Homalodisca vitripennis]|nr:hypothetical protein J6590_000019 [Homalodisca vitripennis]